MNVLGIIPCRMGSTRLPGKPMLDLTGKTLVEHVWERARLAKTLNRLVIAIEATSSTGDGYYCGNGLQQACEKFGGVITLTSPHHPTGMDRCAEVAAQPATDIEPDIIVDIQCDMPEINPTHIDAVVYCLAHTKADIATASAKEIGQYATDPCVWVGRPRRDGDPVFTRDRDQIDPARYHIERHLGIYAFRREVLIHLATAPRPWSEIRDSLEQRRMWHQGCRIVVAYVGDAARSVDTPLDYSGFVSRYRYMP